MTSKANKKLMHIIRSSTQTYTLHETNLLGAILISVKLSNVAHPVSSVVAGVSPQPTSDASIDTASSMATSFGSNAMDHAKKIQYDTIAQRAASVE